MFIYLCFSQFILITGNISYHSNKNIFIYFSNWGAKCKVKLDREIYTIGISEKCQDEYNDVLKIMIFLNVLGDRFMWWRGYQSNRFIFCNVLYIFTYNLSTDFYVSHSVSSVCVNQ